MAAIHPFFCWWLAWGFQTPNISWGFFHKNHWGNPYKATKIYCWLVVWLPSILVSQKYWEFQIIPIDELHHFSEGWVYNNQPEYRIIWLDKWHYGSFDFYGGYAYSWMVFSWKKHPAGWWKNCPGPFQDTSIRDPIFATEHLTKTYIRTHESW